MHDRKSSSERGWLAELAEQVWKSQRLIEASNSAIQRSDELLQELNLQLIGFDSCESGMGQNARNQSIAPDVHLDASTRERLSSSGIWRAFMPIANTRVLVIDDEVTVADTLVLILNQSGFDAIAAYSGEHGLECARQVACDHLVSDVVMFPMNGIEAAIAIRQAIPHCTVLLISGDLQTSQLLAEAARNGHHFEILPKPVHPTEILDRLQTARTSIRADRA